MTIIVAGFFLLYYFKPFSKTDIIVLDHMTEFSDGSINQICLVKNPPSQSKILYGMINDFNKENPTENGLFNRLFIKEHDYIFLPALTLSENIEYNSKTTNRDDLDNIDFLGNSYCKASVNGELIKRTEIYVGDSYYYKK